MAEDTPAAAPAPAKSPKKKAAAKPKKPANHPKYSEMIAKALSSLKERGGSSRQAILKYIAKSYSVGKDDRVINQHLKMALRAGVKNGSLKQSKGTGASGSFYLGTEKAAKPKKVKKPKAAKKPKKPKAKKPKAAGEKKKAKKPKSPKKAKPAKSPKKAKPAKSPKKAKPAKSPKKAKAAKPKKTAKPKKAAKK